MIKKKLLLVMKKAVANKWLNGITEVIGVIKRHHVEQVNSSTQVHSLIVFNLALANYSNKNSGKI